MGNAVSGQEFVRARRSHDVASINKSQMSVKYISWMNPAHPKTQLHLFYQGNGDYTDRVTFSQWKRDKWSSIFVLVHRSQDMATTNKWDFFGQYYSRWNGDFDLCTFPCVPPLFIWPKFLPTEGTRTQQSIHQPQPLIALHHFSLRCLSVEEFRLLRSLGAESKHLFRLTLRST